MPSTPRAATVSAPRAYPYSPTDGQRTFSSICFTSPPNHGRFYSIHTPRRHGGETSNNGFASPGSAGFLVATPPTPDSCGGTGGGGSDAVTACRTAISRAVYRCNLPGDLATAVERLSWVAEQVLLPSLHSIGRTLASVEHRCTPIQWQQLEVLRDSFVKSAVSHLETELSVHSTNVALPASSTAILAQFHKVAAEAERLHHAFLPPPSSSTPPCHVADTERRQDTLRRSPRKSMGTPQRKGKTVNGDTDNPRHPSSLIGTPLTRRAVQIVRRCSVVRLQQVLSRPPEKRILACLDTKANDDDGQQPCDASIMFSSPVSRHAQKRLGEIWQLMDQFGVGRRFLDAATSGVSVVNKQQHQRWSKPPPPALRETTQPHSDEKDRSFGALHLMGARCSRRGRYVSRKTITGKARRTRERNAKQAFATSISEPHTTADAPTTSTPLEQLIDKSLTPIAQPATEACDGDGEEPMTPRQQRHHAETVETLEEKMMTPPHQCKGNDAHDILYDPTLLDDDTTPKLIRRGRQAITT